MGTPPRLKGFQYSGELTPAMAARGVQAVMANAEQLLTEAILLWNNKHFCRAVVLAILAIEEAGKSQVLLHILCSKTDGARRKLWKEFRTHTSKTGIAAVAHIQATTAATLDAALIDWNDVPKMFEDWKQSALYADAFGKGYWRIPEEQVPLEKAQWVVATAQRVITSKGMNVYANEKYLELWKKHACIAQEKDKVEWALAMIKLQEEAFSAGLISQEELDAAKHFFGSQSLRTKQA